MVQNVENQEQMIGATPILRSLQTYFMEANPKHPPFITVTFHKVWEINGNVTQTQWALVEYQWG
jgi:hypothetical protein